MSLQQGTGGDQQEPVGRLSGTEEIRPATRSSVLAVGTLACPSCDAPASLGAPLSPADPLACGFCDHAGAVRDFLSLGAPTRPARVLVRVLTA